MGVKMVRKGEEKRKTVNICLSPKELKWLKEDADEAGMPMSMYVRVRLLYSGEKAKRVLCDLGRR